MTADIIGLPTIREAKKVRTLREVSEDALANAPAVTQLPSKLTIAINAANLVRLTLLAKEWDVGLEEAAGMVLGQALNPRCK